MLINLKIKTLLIQSLVLFIIFSKCFTNDYFNWWSLFFITRQIGTTNKSMDFGKSRARLHESNKVTFKEFAGLTEEKESKELIDFLKIQKVSKTRSKNSKGVYYGPPEQENFTCTCSCGETNVPFYYISGSDFVELFVGVGESCS